MVTFLPIRSMIDLNKFPIPKPISEIIQGALQEEVALGESKSTIFRVHRNGKEDLYLKLAAENTAEPIKPEVERLNWLIQFVNVPRVWHYEMSNGYEFLLMSTIAGVPSHEAIENKSQTIRECARGLKLIHDIPVSQCHFDNRLDIKLDKARKRVEQKIVDEHDFSPERYGQKAEDLFREAMRYRPESEDLVVTHGDYCMPNIIIRDGHLSGFVDLSGVGIADRYQDLALAVRSIERNFSKDWNRVFFEEYGSTPNAKKIEYYKLLDELF